MRKIQEIKSFNVDGNEVIIISKNYQGKPMIFYKYDILIGNKETIDMYYNDLLPEHQLKDGWLPRIFYI